MKKLNEQSLKALLAQAGLEPKEGDLERFGDLLDHYVTSLKELQSVKLDDEEIAPTFHPEAKTK